MASAEATSVHTIADTEFCMGNLFALPTEDTPRLNPKQIHLLNWNTHKYADIRAHDVLLHLGNKANLILLQESIQDYTHMPTVRSQLHWEFAPGYIKNGIKTGVMTASTAAPIAACKLTSTEPWLRTPKATNITRYALSGTDETLLVINIHLINFTFGIHAMQTQLEQALAFVERHTGPVIISGDFNTWSKKRSKAVLQSLNKLGLQPIKYTNDQRTQIFGMPVDHLFIRDIHVSAATSYSVESSDHNPISVVLEMLLPNTHALQ
ncbi:MAG: endonuclease/exonuclease/phosphatase family protein [Gammaproteobacteria bacterium]|nr:endonuclease/exonuclease/phosphatase family protein [Gammaproteobacteria bacterium]MCP4929756.1 endonuclease/exonuclease/phosphatase family protein [Gammaproteobacteria bacterium]